MAEVKLITIECAVCHTEYGVFPVKEAPKAFVCPVCNTGQQVTPADYIHHSYKRNYPEGHYENG